MSNNVSRRRKVIFLQKYIYKMHFKMFCAPARNITQNESKECSLEEKCLPTINNDDSNFYSPYDKAYKTCVISGKIINSISFYNQLTSWSKVVKFCDWLTVWVIYVFLYLFQQNMKHKKWIISINIKSISSILPLSNPR